MAEGERDLVRCVAVMSVVEVKKGGLHIVKSTLSRPIASSGMSGSVGEETLCRRMREERSLASTFCVAYEKLLESSSVPMKFQDGRVEQPRRG